MKVKLQESRRSLRLCGLALLSLLTLTTALPVRAASGQSADPAAQAQNSVQQDSPQKTEAETPGHEDDKYLHAPVVQWMARQMHVSVETASLTFLILNFSVVVFGIGIPLFRMMPRVMRKRSEKIRADVESARKTTEDAKTRLSAVEAKLASLDQEIAKFRTEVEQQIAQDEQRGKAALEEESARIVASAEQEIGVAAAQARRSLRHFAADLAIDQAVKKLTLTPETDRALIAQFVSEAGDGMNGGGKN